MGAIQRGDLTFEVEYSVSHQNAAVHVYRNGVFKQELPFQFKGKKPEEEEIEQLVNKYCDGTIQ